MSQQQEDAQGLLYLILALPYLVSRPGPESKTVTQNMRCGGPTEREKQLSDLHLRAPGEYNSSKEQTLCSVLIL